MPESDELGVPGLLFIRADKKDEACWGTDEEKPVPGARLPRRYGKSLPLSPVSAGLGASRGAGWSCGLLPFDLLPAKRGIRVGVAGFGDVPDPECPPSASASMLADAAAPTTEGEPVMVGSVPRE